MRQGLDVAAPALSAGPVMIGGALVALIMLGGDLRAALPVYSEYLLEKMEVLYVDEVCNT